LDTVYQVILVLAVYLVQPLKALHPALRNHRPGRMLICCSPSNAFIYVDLAVSELVVLSVIEHDREMDLLAVCVPEVVR